MPISTIRKVLATAAATTMIVAGLAASASAYGGESGKLLVHGPGTAYTGGGDSIVTITTTAGGSAVFAFEIKNTGETTAQYNLTVSNSPLSYPASPLPTLVLTDGSVIGTPLAQTANGYFTGPILPGKTRMFTLKATVAAGSPAGAEWYQQLVLNDTTHNQLDSTNTEESVTATKSTFGNDQIATGAGGQKPTIYPAGTAYVTDPSTPAGGKSVYTIKLENDSTAPDQIGYLLFDFSACAADFPATIKAGTTDVTAAVLAGTYLTPVLAPGKFVTLTITVTYSGNPTYCGTGSGSDIWNGQSTDGSDYQQNTFIYTNPVAS